MLGLFLLLTQFSLSICYAGPDTFTYIYENGTTVRISLFKKWSIMDMFFNKDDTTLYNIGMMWIVANVIGILFIYKILYRLRLGEDNNSADDSADDSADNEDSPDEKKINYESQYFDKLEELSDKELTTDELKVISEHVLIEKTPKGLINMTYNVDTGTFEYYTDKYSEMSYEILDTVARLFTVTFNCKRICVNYREEIKNGENRMMTEIEYDKMIAEKDKEIKNNKDNNERSNGKERSVFATFKTYNKKNGNNVAKKYYIITEKSNRFKYKGRLSDYKSLLEKTTDDNMVNNYKKISYSDFKLLQKEMQM